MRLLGVFLAAAMLVLTVAAPASAQLGPAAIDDASIVVQKCCTDDGSHQIITGSTWAAGDLIDLYINAAYIATDIAEPNDTGTASPSFDADTVQIFVEPGDEVTFVRPTDGRTETHVVTPLTVTNMAIATDTVEGVTSPGADVVLWIPGTAANRTETADADGNWAVDFSTPGDQPGEAVVFDFDGLTTIAAAEFDADGNATFWATNPGQYAPIIVLVDGAQILAALGLPITGSQWISGQSWSDGEPVDLSINGTYIATSLADGNAEGTASPFFDIGELGISVVAGDEVTFARPDGTRTETHIVRDLALTAVDVAADTVTGTAVAGSDVFVATVPWLSDVTAAGVVATTDGAGKWLADFAPFVDLTVGTIGVAGQVDEFGNSTTLFWTPLTKERCKKGGWQALGFRNQGQCIKAAIR